MKPQPCVDMETSTHEVGIRPCQWCEAIGQMSKTLGHPGHLVGSMDKWNYIYC